MQMHSLNNATLATRHEEEVGHFHAKHAFHPDQEGILTTSKVDKHFILI